MHVSSKLTCHKDIRTNTAHLHFYLRKRVSKLTYLRKRVSKVFYKKEMTNVKNLPFGRRIGEHSLIHIFKADSSALPGGLFEGVACQPQCVGEGSDVRYKPKSTT